MQQKGQCQINQTVEVQHEKKPTSNLKSMQSVGFEKTTKFIVKNRCRKHLIGHQ